MTRSEYIMEKIAGFNAAKIEAAITQRAEQFSSFNPNDLTAVGKKTVKQFKQNPELSTHLDSAIASRKGDKSQAAFIETKHLTNLKKGLKKDNIGITSPGATFYD